MVLIQAVDLVKMKTGDSEDRLDEGGEESERVEDEATSEGADSPRLRTPMQRSDPRSEGRWPYDRWWVEEGMLWVEHQCPRRRTMVPGGDWGPYYPAEFRRERFTMFYRAEAPRDEDDAWQIMDDWQVQGECDGPFPLWVGVTVFLFKDTPLPAQFPFERWLQDRRRSERSSEPEDSPGDHGDCSGSSGSGESGDEAAGTDRSENREPSVADAETSGPKEGHGRGAEYGGDDGRLQGRYGRECGRGHVRGVGDRGRWGQGDGSMFAEVGSVGVRLRDPDGRERSLGPDRDAGHREGEEQHLQDESKTRDDVRKSDLECWEQQDVDEGAYPGSTSHNGWKAGSSRWKNFAEEGLSEEVAQAAYAYVEEIDAIQDAEADTWRRVCQAGNRLLSLAGGVQEAATALWIAREILGRNNLEGVDDGALDGLLHEDWVAYLREVRAEGMPARFVGERSRVKTRPHPRARANMFQVYQQLMKDVAKHRVLVVDHLHSGLRNTISSPFEAVPKMLPNRTMSQEVRLVHDQRLVNTGTDKELHPPAVQPLHQQVIRRILWLKARYPGVKVVMAKKDVAGAFRLLWVDPRDVELFGGDVPWQPGEMGSGSAPPQSGDPTGMTMLYLVSSFGFSGSPGEWTVWGRATEELHRAHRPVDARRDGAVNFDGKILVDDMVLVEPCLGLRPWISAETYQWGVMKLLGDKAVNLLKDAEEGVYGPEQLVWGVAINTETERMSLPEARILKGAYLLQNPEFNYGEKSLTLKDLQRFRGIANGWATIIGGLKNELKAADRFLSGVDGSATIWPKIHEENEVQEDQAWEDLWHLFEDCRWLCARSETWAEKFGGDIREVLQPLERLALPGQLRQVVFVSSDATLDVLAAIDWTTGHVCREELEYLKPWITQVVESESLHEDQKLAIHIGEMLSFVAFACKMGPMWVGKVVVYGGDNKVVYHWINGRKSNVRAGRLLVRVLNMVEMRYRCRIFGGWWRTYHNEDADALTRLGGPEAQQLVEDRGWTWVDIKRSIQEALCDTERFGPCFLSWADQEDREEMMRLRELRIFRSLHRQPEQVSNLQILEWTADERMVKDFEFFNCGGASGPKVVAASIGPDPKAFKVQKFFEFLAQETCDVAVLEGPREVAWEAASRRGAQDGWKVDNVEFLTSELGEMAVRRRVAMFLHHCGDLQPGDVDAWMARAVTPPSIGSTLKAAELTDLVYYEKYEPAMGQGSSPMLPLVGAHVWIGTSPDRRTVYRMSGPVRWPLISKEDGGFEEIYVVDKAAKPGSVRRLTMRELWLAQGRRGPEWDELELHRDGNLTFKEGCAATGRRTALALLCAAAEVAARSGHERKAGMCWDAEDVKSLTQILRWLRRWRKGELRRAEPDRKAGGYGQRLVWLWGEDLWLGALDYLSVEMALDDGKAGGRRKSTKAEEKEAEKIVCLQPGVVGDPNIQAQIEEWLEEHMDGDKAPSTKKAYNAAWCKWCDWARRQGWLSPYLDHRADPVTNENKVLGYLGYLGWLGTTVATMKQAVFALKDAHKRAGHGDTTNKMHRLWIVLNSLDRMSAKKPRRLGVTVPMLKWIGQHLEKGAESYGELKVDCRMLQAALLTAWFFMMRAKEYCDSSGVDEEMILRGQDVVLTARGQEAKEGFPVEEATIQFRKTKADQEAFGTCKTMLRTEVQHVCVVNALEKLFEAAPRRFRGPEAHLPLFRWATGGVLKRLEVQNILQKAARATGLPAERFQSHSLRIGGASALFQATGEVELVKRTGRWTSSAVHRYLHDSGDVLKGLSKKMASVDQYVHYT